MCENNGRANDRHSQDAAPSITDVLVQIEEHLAALREDRVAPSPDWLTVEEAARHIRLSRDTIERLIGSGQLKAAAIETPKGRGRRSRYRIQREWLDEFMQSRTRPNAASERSPARRRRRFKAPHDFIG